MNKYKRGILFFAILFYQGCSSSHEIKNPDYYVEPNRWVDDDTFRAEGSTPEDFSGQNVIQKKMAARKKAHKFAEEIIIDRFASLRCEYKFDSAQTERCRAEIINEFGPLIENSAVVFERFDINDGSFELILEVKLSDLKKKVISVK